MNLPFYQVDAFTNQPFKGNPAGVCLLEAPLKDRLLRAIAAESNLAETAFLLSKPDGYGLRWFTPQTEVPLCGHATLATAHILWEKGLEPTGKTLRFNTLSGVLTASRENGWIELDLPARGNEPCIIPPDLAQLFAGVFVHAVYSVDRYILELSSAASIREFTPDEALLKKHRFVITSKGEEGSSYDFISRYFAGPVGVTEDPVTGTAHCSLATYWAERLHKNRFFAYQASPRGGELKLTLRNGRVLLQGEAVTVIEGRINL